MHREHAWLGKALIEVGESTQVVGAEPCERHSFLAGQPRRSCCSSQRRASTSAPTATKYCGRLIRTQGARIFPRTPSATRHDSRRRDGCVPRRTQASVGTEVDPGSGDLPTRDGRLWSKDRRAYGRSGRGANQRPPNRPQGEDPLMNTTLELNSLRGVVGCLDGQGRSRR